MRLLVCGETLASAALRLLQLLPALSLPLLPATAVALAGLAWALLLLLLELAAVVVSWLCCI